MARILGRLSAVVVTAVVMSDCGCYEWLFFFFFFFFFAGCVVVALIACCIVKIVVIVVGCESTNQIL